MKKDYDTQQQAVTLMDEKMFRAALEKALSAEKADKAAKVATKLLFVRLACSAGFRASLSGKADQADRLFRGLKAGKSAYQVVCADYLCICAGGYKESAKGLIPDMSLSILTKTADGYVIRKGVGRAEKKALVTRASILKSRNPLSCIIAREKRQEILDKRFLVKAFDKINEAIQTGSYLPELEKQFYQLRQDLTKILETI